MPVDERFVEAFIHRPQHVVFGRRLRPFCLWHRLLLRTVDSPLLSAGRPITALHLDQAVSICRCRYGHTDFRARSTTRLFWQIAAGGLGRAARAFYTYLADYSSPPVHELVLTREQRNAPPTMPRGRPPAELCTVAAVVGWSKCPVERAWEMPIGEAEWYAAMALEAAGAPLDFEDEDERQFLADLKARDVQAKRGGLT